MEPSTNGPAPFRPRTAPQAPSRSDSQTAGSLTLRPLLPGGDLPLVTLDQAHMDGLPTAAPAIADILPATPMQAAMLRHSLSTPSSDA